MSKPKTPQNALITKCVPNAPERPRRCRGDDVERDDVERGDVEREGYDINIPKVKRRLAFELVKEEG